MRNVVAVSHPTAPPRREGEGEEKKKELEGWDWGLVSLKEELEG